MQVRAGDEGKYIQELMVIPNLHSCPGLAVIWAKVGWRMHAYELGGRRAVSLSFFSMRGITPAYIKFGFAHSLFFHFAHSTQFPHWMKDFVA